MTTKHKFKSDAFAAIHALAAALQRVGAVDQTTMRQFDGTCLAVPTTLAPTQIKNIRKQVHVSQPVFARFDGCTKHASPVPNHQFELWAHGKEHRAGPTCPGRQKTFMNAPSFAR